jgi:hypothetical protein
MTGLDNPVATGGSAMLAALFIQWLKNSGWASWFTRDTDKANLALSLVIALATSMGIHLSFDQSTGNGVIAFSTHQLYGAFVQWATQHGSYKLLIAVPESLGEIRALLQRSLPPPISEGAAKVHAEK